VAPVVERLAASRRVLLVDYSAEKHRTLGGLADEIADTVALAVSAPVDVLGQSIGSILAADLACRTAVDVRRVVLVSTFTVLRWRTLAVASALIPRTPAGLYRRTSALLMGLVCGPVGSGRDHPFLDAVRSSDPAAAAKRTDWEVGREFSVELSALAATGRPTLVLMGAADRFVRDVRSETARLAELFGSSSVASVDGAGHVFLPHEAVTEAVERIERFLG
jgi:pimeloyl-ACP methyl ester carboxylesterase